MSEISITINLADRQSMGRLSRMLLAAMGEDITVGGEPAKSVEAEPQAAPPPPAEEKAQAASMPPPPPVEEKAQADNDDNAAARFFGGESAPSMFDNPAVTPPPPREQQQAAPPPPQEQQQAAPPPPQGDISKAGQPGPNANAQGHPHYNAHGILVDGLGLPWDSRINTESRVCLAKKPHEWKIIRKTPDETVEQVRAELRAAMQAPAPAADSAPATPATTPAGPAATGSAPPPPPENKSHTAVVDFPTLMKAVAETAKTDEQLMTAVQAAGLPSLPLLATRPDLVPTVAKALGL